MGFFKNPSFKIAMYVRAGVCRGWASSEVYFLVNLFENPSIMPLGGFLVYIPIYDIAFKQLCYLESDLKCRVN